VTRPDLMALAEAERTDLLSFLQTPTEPNGPPSPSAGSGPFQTSRSTSSATRSSLGQPLSACSFAAGCGSAGSTTSPYAGYRDLDPDGILDLLSRNLRPAGLTSGFRGGIALTDGTIHHQDIRRALGLPRAIPLDRLVPVLNSPPVRQPCRPRTTSRGSPSPRPTRTGVTGQGPRSMDLAKRCSWPSPVARLRSTSWTGRALRPCGAESARASVGGVRAAVRLTRLPGGAKDGVGQWACLVIRLSLPEWYDQPRGHRLELNPAVPHPARTARAACAIRR